MGRETLNLRHLRAVSEIARLGSVSAASAAVHLSQPAVTQALAKLERTLGALLFTRDSTGMFATEAGALFINRVDRALDHLRVGVRRAVAAGGRRGANGTRHLDHLMTGAQLRALLAVAKAGNFSLAARRVGVSQPSLHRLARDLERICGVTLFAKTSQGIDLTQAARRLALHTRLAFAELNQGFEEVDLWRGVDSARIVVGTLPLVRSFILPKAVNDLAAQRPEVDVLVVDGPYDDLLHGLRHGEIDVLIGALRDPPPIDDVVQTELFQDRLGVFGRRGHPLAGRTDLSATGLAAYPWVAPRHGTPTREHFDALFSQAGLAPPTGLVETSSMVMMRALLMNSDRLTMISTHQIRFEEQRGSVERLELDLSHTSRPIGTTVRRNWQPTATQSLFLDLLKRASTAAVDGWGPVCHKP